MESLVDLADEWLLTFGTVSEETRKVHGRGVTQFGTWLGEAHPDVIEPGAITRRHVDGWMRALTEDARSEGSGGAGTVTAPPRSSGSTARTA